MNSDGIFCIEYFYDENNLRAVKYWGKNDAPVKNEEGIHCIVYIYDKYQRLAIIEARDTNNELSSDNVYGFAIQYYAYDSENVWNGNKYKYVWFLDEEEKPISNKDYCGMYEAYDANGYLKESAFLNEKYDRVVDKELKYAAVLYENDKKGKPEVIEYLDENDELINNKDGYARMVYKYNDLGLEEEKIFYRADGSYADVQGNGYAVERIKYDEYQRVTEVSFYKEPGKPVNHKEYGYHKVTDEYKRGDVEKRTVSYFDIDGKLVKNMSLDIPNAKVEVNYQNGLITLKEFFDENGNMIYDFERTTEFSAKGERTVKTRGVNPSEGKPKLFFTEKICDSDGLVKSETVKRYGFAEDEKVFVQENGRLDVDWESKYREDGSYTKTTHLYDSNGAEEAEFVTEYDKHGAEITETLTYPDGGMKRQREQEYSDSGEVISEKRYYIRSDGTKVPVDFETE